MDLFRLLSFGPDGWGDELLTGAFLTIRLALATLPFGLALGLLIAVARRSSSFLPRALGNVYSTVFRGLPELLTIFIVYFGGQILLRRIATFVGVTGDFEVNGFFAGMIALGVVFSAYSSEVFLGAFRNIPAGQYEAAQSLGLKRFTTFRLVIWPQLVRLSLPGLANLWLALLKDTSLVSVIAINDLLRMTSLAVRVTKEPFFFFGIACLLYLAMSIVSSVGISAIERWAGRGQRRTA
ncbi:ABC transporter permease [Kaistia algarum]|uniref:ABC transporter permease n=1 Tax=Kaistia algarum TaxID=2083279 RepID=UPI001A9C8BFE|nr:ABC transporter permease [Kaistia algarum]MCX5514664.1 ABC transporter permease [Kaistia algarum]